MSGNLVSTANFQKARNTASGEGNQARGHLISGWTQNHLYFQLIPWKYHGGSAVINLLLNFFFHKSNNFLKNKFLLSEKLLV